ncbi:3-isopropylmalate dehydratase large subunit [Achlya hypogyna]|uniref:3-isopropylmalate dehydratase large subunit n=1 Tax=Achlya hypogyna TaxID=1202772 RepID=A0A1V9YYA2_ACHHY|nr:3-isopropylmalate dehydratase large subunit [Achlya hypogyna]
MAVRPMNVIEKILCHHAVGLTVPSVSVGDVLCVNADWTLASELTFQGMETLYASIGRPALHRPDRFWLAIDHTVDPRVNHQSKQQALIKLATDFATEHNVSDFWEPNTTIMHTEFARKRAQPGQIVIGADSHTCSAGGMGAFAAGLGAGDVVMPLVTGQTWFKVPEVVFIEFTGAPALGIGGKDIILHILGHLKRNTVAFERAVYYGGAGLAHLSDDARFAIANMSTEFGAIAGVFEADDVTARVLAKRESHKDEGLYFRPDAGCSYAAHHVIRLEEVVSMVAIYPSPDNCAPITELGHMALDGCFIGACTTTQEDLILGAMVLQIGLSSGLVPAARADKPYRRRVTPGSLDIVAHLKQLGLLAVYEAAGFTVGVPSCSFCVGIGADVALEGEVWLTSQNRNFRNRMGRGSIGHLASAVAVAASSFSMTVTDPAPFVAQIDFALFDAYRQWTPAPPSAPLFVEATPAPVLSAIEVVEAPASPTAKPPPAKFSGRVQVFEDNVDTDAIIPAQFMGLNPTSPLWPADCKTEEEVLAAKSFAYTRPEFVERARAGANIIVAGTAFGSGSSREEAARCLKALGIQAVIAKSFAYIYARNQPNNALLGIVITDERFHTLATEGAEVHVDLPGRAVSVAGETFGFQLTALEESFLNGGGLQQLFRRYKTDLFRAAMQQKTKAASSACGGETSCGSPAATEW